MRIIPDISLTLKEIESFLNANGEYIGNHKINAITTNSKLVQPNDLFIALGQGEKFTEEAFKNGAFVISSEYENATFKVSDTTASLLNIAKEYKARLPLSPHTVAITGSVGKTTTKNVIAKILSQKFKTHATCENKNNAIGLSYTILATPKDTEVLVLEMGMNHIGEISNLSLAARPDIAVITNIGNAHIGNLGSRENIARAKLEITNGMRGGRIVIPAEEKLLENVSNSITVSTDTRNADVFIHMLDSSYTGMNFDILSKKYDIKKLHLNLCGEHLLWAIGYATAVAEYLELEENELCMAIEEIDKGINRARFFDIADFTVYDDTYSASPEATKAVFKMLSLYKRTMSCVLGDMLELGKAAPTLHEEIGKEAYGYGFEKMYLFGKYAPFIAKGAMNAGMKRKNIFINEDINSPEATAMDIIRNRKKGELIMFKGSHAIHMERILQEIKKLL